MSRLSKIGSALEDVEASRQKCPFHGRYRGHMVHGFDDACKLCGKRRNGDGGRCLIDRAEHTAIIAIEEAVA